MKSKKQTVLSSAVILVFVLFVSCAFLLRPFFRPEVAAQESKTTAPTPTPEFDQGAAVAKLREQIKGREQEPAETVFKNIQNFKGVPAGRLLAIMQFGFSRSLGVTCTHCHTPENWAAETKPTKQIARDMQLMAAKINEDLLKNIKGLEGRNAIVNCTTCHRGEVKPALNLPMAAKPEEKKSR
ncbi:MAG: c-type cytochrome [Pyrinomonadaceae bacterium]